MIRLEKIFKISLQDILGTSSKLLEDVLKMSWMLFARRLEDVLKTSWKRLEDVLKMSWRRFCKAPSRRIEDVLKIPSEDVWLIRIYSSSSRRLEDVFWRRRRKTSLRRLQDVFIKANVCWVCQLFSVEASS